MRHYSQMRRNRTSSKVTPLARNPRPPSSKFGQQESKSFQNLVFPISVFLFINRLNSRKFLSISFLYRPPTTPNCNQFSVRVLKPDSMSQAQIDAYCKIEISFIVMCLNCGHKIVLNGCIYPEAGLPREVVGSRKKRKRGRLCSKHTGPMSWLYKLKENTCCQV